MASDVALRARLQQQPLLAQFAGEVGDAGGAQRRDGAVRLAVGQVDHGQARGDLRARRALQPLVDLVLQEFGGLIEQVDRDQPVGQPADHLVAAPPDRRQFADIRRTSPSASTGGRSSPFGLRKSWANSAAAASCACRDSSEFGCSRVAVRAAASDFAVAAGLGIDLRHHLQRLHLERVAAPDHRQRLELAQRVGLADLVALLPQRDLAAAWLRPPPAGPDEMRRELVVVERVLVVAERFGEPAAQHRDRRLHLRRDADDVEIAAALGGAGIILDLERGAHRIRQSRCAAGRAAAR